MKGELRLDGRRLISWLAEITRAGNLQVQAAGRCLGVWNEVLVAVLHNGLVCGSRRHERPFDRRALLELIQHVRELRRELEGARREG
jgi:hypothetical protein